MYSPTFKRFYTIAGLFMIATGIFGLFVVLTGRSWNCPQPAGLNVSRIAGNLGQVLLGTGILFQLSRPKLSLIFFIPSIIAMIISMYFLFTTLHNDCSPSSNLTQQHTLVKYSPLRK